MSDKDLRGPILIFGASGFIGANLYQRIAKGRDDVWAVTSGFAAPKRIQTNKLLRCDVTLPADILNIKWVQPQTIFFLSSYGNYSWQTDAHRIFETNVMGFLDVAEAFPQATIIHGGSSSEYGHNSKNADEGFPLVPNSYYSVTKASISHLVGYLGGDRGRDVANLRLYSIYGPMEDERRLIPSLLTHARNNAFPPLASPHTSRDFVYVDDAVEALVQAALQINNIRGKSINVASGKKTTIEDLTKLMQTLFNVTAHPNFQSYPDREWDMSEWYGSAERARLMLGWQPLTHLHTGLRKTMDWMKDNA